VVVGPLTLVAAAIDLLVGGKHGRLFYKTLEWARATDEAIDLYAAIGGYHPNSHERGGGASVRGTSTIDSLLARVETVIVCEYQKGATAARIKEAVDRAIDELQLQGAKGRDKLEEVLQGASEPFRSPAE
jgi:hypothetical protein